MNTVRTLAHLFLPHESNNLKAKILHNSSLLILAILLVAYQLTLSFFPSFAPRVLGYAANIPPSEVIRLTNEKRVQAGLSPLKENASLSQAAQTKAADMIAKDYWAHVAPDGTQPWKFFTDSGYKYRFAGENLARDFSAPNAAVEAWMASPSHKENLLSPKYKEIGVAVVEGDLAGVDTTIVVQLFGTKFIDTIPSLPIAGAQVGGPLETPQPSPEVAQSPAPSPLAEVTPQILVSPFYSTRTISVFVVLVLVLLLSVDLIVVSHRRIARATGRTLAHLAFFGMVLTIIVILKAGQIL